MVSCGLEMTEVQMVNLRLPNQFLDSSHSFFFFGSFIFLLTLNILMDLMKIWDDARTQAEIAICIMSSGSESEYNMNEASGT